MSLKIGIDLGTTYSAAALFDKKQNCPVIIKNINGEPISPSMIYISPTGELKAGSAVQDTFRVGEEGVVTAFKRKMGSNDFFVYANGKGYTPVELSAALLRQIKEDVEFTTGQEVEEAVITVPAYFFDKERRATLEAAQLAGLKVKQIINEPTAAALTYGTNHWRENARILVYDLGGGTFDVTLIEMKEGNRMESIRTTGNHTLGGKDWDQALVDLVLGKIYSQTGYDAKEDCELINEINSQVEDKKKLLSKRESVRFGFFISNLGFYKFNITREEFDLVTEDLLQKTILLCQSILEDLGITWKDITDILLVGGSTRMKQVSETLERISGHKPLSQVHPDEAVALGAAIQANLPRPSYLISNMDPKRNNQRTVVHEMNLTSSIGKEKKLSNVLAIAPSDVVAHAMGIIAVNAEGTQYINKTIIPSNQFIPVKCAEALQFYTTPNGDNEVEIYVLQGIKDPLDCKIIGKYVVSGIKHNRKDNPTLIRIQYSYDLNGMVHVQARQNDQKTDLPIREESVEADLSRFAKEIDPSEFRSIAQPLSVMMAIDVSGSMSGTPIEDAKKAMHHFVDELENYSGEVKIGVIAVSDSSQIVQKPTSHFSQVRKAIDQIKSCMTGVCNDGHPFNDIEQSLNDQNGKRLGIVLADGLWSNTDRAIEAAKVCHRCGIDIVGVGFGLADKQFLDAISSGDVSSMLVSQSELKQSFGKIAQEISSAKGLESHAGTHRSWTNTWKAVDEE